MRNELGAISATHENERYIQFLLFAIPFLMGCGVDLYIPSLPTIATQFQVPNRLVLELPLSNRTTSQPIVI